MSEVSPDEVAPMIADVEAPEEGRPPEPMRMAVSDPDL